MKKYYEMDITIKGKILVPVDNYDEDKELAIESIETTTDIGEIARRIDENNNEPSFVFVNKNTIKEVER